MGLACGTPTRFMPAAAAARTAQATTITPALGAGVKKGYFMHVGKCTDCSRFALLYEYSLEVSA